MENLISIKVGDKEACVRPSIICQNEAANSPKSVEVDDLISKDTATIIIRFINGNTVDNCQMTINGNLVVGGLPVFPENTTVEYTYDGTSWHALGCINNTNESEGGEPFELQPATSNALGGIMIGYTENGKNYPVQLDGNDKAYVYVPWKASEVAGGGEDITQITEENHYDPIESSVSELTASLSGTAGTYAKDTEYTVLTGVKAQRDAKGHVTGLTYTAQKIKDTNTDTKVTSADNHYTPVEDTNAAISATNGTATNITGTAGKLNVVTGVKRDAKGHIVGVTSANIYSTDNAGSGSGSYELPSATSNALGGIKIGYTENGKNYPVELDDEKAFVNVPWEGYTHPTGPGYKHIPTGGVSGDVLTWKANGEAQWAPATSTNGNLNIYAETGDTISPIFSYPSTDSENPDVDFTLKAGDNTYFTVADKCLTINSMGNSGVNVYDEVGLLPDDAVAGSLGIVRTVQQMKSAFLGNINISSTTLSYEKDNIKDISSTFDLNLETTSNDLSAYPTNTTGFTEFNSGVSVVLESKDNDIRVQFDISFDGSDCILNFNKDGDYINIASRPNYDGAPWTITNFDYENEIEPHIASLGKRWGLVYFQYSTHVVGSDALQGVSDPLYNWINHVFNLKYNEDTLYRVNNDGLWVEDDYVAIKKQTYSTTMYPNKLYHATTDLDRVALYTPDTEYVYEYLLEFDNTNGDSNIYMVIPVGAGYKWSYYKHLPVADALDNLNDENFIFIDPTSTLYLYKGHKVRIHFMDQIVTITSLV